MRVKAVCVCVCVCVRLLLLNRYLDFDGNCRKLTVIIQSNYSAYFYVPVRWEVPVRGRKRGRIGDLYNLRAIYITVRARELTQSASIGVPGNSNGSCELAWASERSSRV